MNDGVKIMKVKTVAEKHSFKPVKIFSSIVCTLFFTMMMSPAVAMDNRFNPPTFSAPLDEFNSRISSGNRNIDFIVAQVLNNARQIERSGEDFKNNASLYKNQSGGTANAGSVVIPPGTNADTIIVINQNDGDSYAIQR